MAKKVEKILVININEHKKGLTLTVSVFLFYEELDKYCQVVTFTFNFKRELMSQDGKVPLHSHPRSNNDERVHHVAGKVKLNWV